MLNALDLYFSRLGRLCDPKEICKKLRHLGVTLTQENDSSALSVDEPNAHFVVRSFDCALSLSGYFSLLEFATGQSYFDFGKVSPSNVSEAVTIAPS